MPTPESEGERWEDDRNDKYNNKNQVYVAKIPRILNDGRFLSPSSPTSSHSTKCEPQDTPLSMICNLKGVQGKKRGSVTDTATDDHTKQPP